MTVFVGIFCWWMVNDFPDTARFLTADEKLRALRRLRADNQARAETERLSMKYVWAAVRDWKTWGYAVCYMGCLCPLYSEWCPNDTALPHIDAISRLLSFLAYHFARHGL